ncbi:MAG: hypothetical protein V1701_02710 [Planctomycetota bacterium]
MPNYPDSAELKRIQEWDAINDALGLLEFIKPLFEEYGRIEITGKMVKRVKMATGGWSGNEEIIGALRRNLMFWPLYWEKSQRGGAYWFRIDTRINKRKQ